MTVVGVAGDTKSHGLTEADVPAVYTPYVQRTEAWQRWSSLVVRSRAPRPEIEQRVMRRAVSGTVDPLVPIGRIRATSMGTRCAVGRDVAAACRRHRARGICSRGVADRRSGHLRDDGVRRGAAAPREIGIRVAIGATRHAGSANGRRSRHAHDDDRTRRWDSSVHSSRAALPRASCLESHPPIPAPTSRSPW